MADCDYNPHVYTSKKLIFLSVATYVGVIRRVRFGVRWHVCSHW